MGPDCIFYSPCRCRSAAKFVYSGLNPWVHSRRIRGFSLSNCPAELLWYWNCHWRFYLELRFGQTELCRCLNTPFLRVTTALTQFFWLKSLWLTSEVRQNSQDSVYNCVYCVAIAPRHDSNGGKSTTPFWFTQIHPSVLDKRMHSNGTLLKQFSAMMFSR